MYMYIWHSLVLPHKTTPVKGVPDHIQKPPYAFTGVVGPKPLDIDIKTEEQIAVMRDTCQLARKILDSAGRHLKACTCIKLILSSLLLC